MPGKRKRGKSMMRGMNMKRRLAVTTALAAAALLLGAAPLAADTLVLRDGRRIEGQLISVQRGIIEFREDRGFRGSRIIQVRREEVQRIDIEDVRVAPPEPDDRRGRVEGGGRPNGLREREAWVAANAAWADTGIDVRDGQVVYFTTHNGDIQWRRGEHTRAAGDPGAPYNPNRPIPSRPIGALIGKIGAASTDYFFIGDNEGPMRMRGGGRLYLGINDENLRDNQGAYRVTVYF